MGILVLKRQGLSANPIIVASASKLLILQLGVPQHQLAGLSLDGRMPNEGHSVPLGAWTRLMPSVEADSAAREPKLKIADRGRLLRFPGKYINISLGSDYA
ncbi:hypothetical protein LA080_012014 [Diaporthe eres]|nr:hypothetical protein LA080_012014 [Diaporthe eres]